MVRLTLFLDIVLVNLNPQRNDEAGKIRPCVIVSDSDVNEILDLVTIIPCTTNLLGEGLFRIFLQAQLVLKLHSLYGVI